MAMFNFTHAIYASSFLVVLSNSMIALALPWLVLQRTESIIVTGMVGSLSLTALFMGSLFSHQLIRYLGSKTIILCGFFFNIITISGIIFCFSQDTLNIPLIILFAVIDKVFDATGNIALEFRFPEIARYSKISVQRLNSIQEGLFNGGSILGAASAGLLLSFINPLYVFAIAGLVSFLALINFLPLLSIYKNNRQPQKTVSLFASTRWIWGQQHLRSFLIIIMMVMASIASLDDVLMPAFITATTGNPADIGFILASYSVTGIFSATLYAAYHQAFDDIWIIRAGIIGVVIFFIGLILFDNPVWIILNTCLTGILSGPLWPIINSRFMQETPKHMRLGMLASISTLSVGVAPVMVIVHAWIIQQFSIETLCIAIALTGIMTLLLKIEPKH